jgi:hypothetical protein
MTSVSPTSGLVEKTTWFLNSFQNFLLIQSWHIINEKGNTQDGATVMENK